MASGRDLLLLFLACCLLTFIPNISAARSLSHDAGILAEKQTSVSVLGFRSQGDVMHHDDTPSEQESSERLAMHSRESIPGVHELELALLGDLDLAMLYEGTPSISSQESSDKVVMHSHASELPLLDDNISSIQSLLNQSGLPIGLLPSSVASYAITAEGDFIVSLQEPCYVDFDYEVYYARTITGTLSYGTITNLSGIQAKEAFFWVPITAIRTDVPSSEFIYFNVGPISKKLPIGQFETIPICKAKSMAV